MREYTKETESWRTCDNCVHNTVCGRNKESCAHHIYNANPVRYGDFDEIMQPVYEWISCHYPNCGGMFVDKRSANVYMTVHQGFSEEIRTLPSQACGKSHEKNM